MYIWGFNFINFSRMKDSKLLLGLAIGVAVGAAIGYLAATDKKEQILDELSNMVGKVKESVQTAVHKYKEKTCTCTCDAAENADAAE